MVVAQTAANAPALAAVAGDPPAGVRALMTGALGSGAQVIRFGHLSDPDSVEAIGAVPAPGMRESSDGIPISRLAMLRQNGTEWTTVLLADNTIRNDSGLIANTFQGGTPLYRVNLFRRRFEDGRERFVIQLIPIKKTGERVGSPVNVSWNPSVGRYQQISLEGYGFQPEIYGQVSQ